MSSPPPAKAEKVSIPDWRDIRPVRRERRERDRVGGAVACDAQGVGPRGQGDVEVIVVVERPAAAGVVDRQRLVAGRSVDVDRRDGPGAVPAAVAIRQSAAIDHDRVPRVDAHVDRFATRDRDVEVGAAAARVARCGQRGGRQPQSDHPDRRRENDDPRRAPDVPAPFLWPITHGPLLRRPGPDASATAATRTTPEMRGTGPRGRFRVGDGVPGC